MTRTMAHFVFIEMAEMEKMIWINDSAANSGGQLGKSSIQLLARLSNS